MHYTYFIKSLRNGDIYVGSTSTTPEQRLRQHNEGTNSYTSANKPFKLIYYEEYYCLTDARKRELYYKSGLGKQIKIIIVEYMEKISRQVSSVGRAAVS